jgi:hypothetical protein
MLGTNMRGGLAGRPYTGGSSRPGRVRRRSAGCWRANRRVFGQATIRHAVFGIVRGVLDDALGDERRMLGA